MKHKLIAMTAALLLSVTPLTAYALTEPVVPSVAHDFVHFPRDLGAADFGLIVSSNRECTVTHAENGCTFTPKEDGRYVVSTRAYCEEIVEFGESGHFHYFYPVLKNCTVDVKDGEITVTEQGMKNWFSEEQINAEVQKMNDAIAEGEVEVVACYDVYAADPDDVLNVNYFSFVNGQLPDGENGYDSYITNIYHEYGTESYFCVNYFYSDVATTIPLDRVTALEQDISSLETSTWASSSCSGDLDEATADYMEFSRIAAPEEDGNLTVIVDGTEEYPLTVENGIFHHRKVSEITGDVNADGTFNVIDVVMFQKWLFGKADLTAPQNAELCRDGKLNAFDLAVMKRHLLEAEFEEDIPIALYDAAEIRSNADAHTEQLAYVIRSAEELQEVIAANEYVTDAAIVGIDEEFFTKQALVLLYTRAGAGNQYTTVDNLTIQGNTLHISTTTKRPEIATPDMLYRRFAFAVDKDMADTISQISLQETLEDQ